MKRFAVSFLGVLMIVMAVSGCTGKKPAEQYVSEQLNCSLPAAEKAEASDTHGGFHGEGEYAAAIRFDTVHGAQLAERRQNTDGWKALPLEEELELLMYGGSRGGSSYGYYFADKAGIPKVENGGYYFIDRQQDTERAGLLYRRSYNFSLAIYDSDENILYYCEIDT